jgi:cytochrome c biogenesis protein CcdA/thiol-disulfide isomerase/thioredoxin
MIILAFFAFLSGIVTILSPCILPVLPIILSGSIGGRRKPLGVVTGFVLSFSLFTLILSTLVQALQIPPDALRMAAIVIIVVFGAVLVIPRFQMGFEILASKMVRKKQGSQKSGFKGGIMVGASLGLLWTPCVGPIMASVIGLAVSRQVDGGAVVIIIAYAAGTALPMLGVMLGGRKIINRFPRLTASTGKIQRVFGVVMIVIGLSIGFGLDRRFQTMILTAFPNYGTGLTSFENNSIIRDALNKRASDKPSENEALSWENPPHNGRLDDFGQAPEIVTDGQWFNSDRPLSMEDLKGKVVLLDFWTYSCVNCVRTLPYLRAWHDAYSEQGLVIIGVHSPEFAFERNADNVRKAINELGVSWPVVLDNSFDQWNAYNNRYWPAHYFIDAEGRIRYFHFGEGEYENSEKVIRKLLKEAGNKLSGEAAMDTWNGIESETPETYLGYRRAEGFLSEEFRENNKIVSYELVQTPENGEWSLDGEWIIRGDFIEAADTGVLELGFNAKNVFLVIEPLDEGAQVKVELDGRQAGDTEDVKAGLVLPTESRLYQLAALSEAGEHIIRLTVKGKLRFYAFTFG